MRLRYNNQFGSIGAPLTLSGTTVTFQVVPSFATIVAPDIIPIILEEGTPNEEIAWLTAYTALATTGTILRGQEGTTGVAHASATAWAHGPTVADYLYPSADTIAVINPSVASQTLDLNTATLFDVTLGVATTTFTFANPYGSPLAQSFTIWLRQDGAGSRAVVWPASVKWPSGVAPTISSGINKWDVYSFTTHNGGTTYAGFTAAQDLR